MMTIMFFFYTLLLGMRSGLAYVMSDGVTGRLPALGFNSWNAYNCDINEEHFLSAAEEIIKCGLKDAGYEYVNSKTHSSH
jgi:alpha-galactosidase